MVISLPLQIRAGDTFKQTFELLNYPAPNWTLQFDLVSERGRITIDTAADGWAHSARVEAADTEKWNAANYRYAAKVISIDGDKYTVAEGLVEVLPDLSSTSMTDQRSHVEKVLAALEAQLENRASRSQQETAFNGRQVKHLQPSELLVWRDKYRAELSRIKQADRVSRGMGSGRTIKVRFG